jgi:hypothetical protein
MIVEALLVVVEILFQIDVVPSVPIDPVDVNYLKSLS